MDPHAVGWGVCVCRQTSLGFLCSTKSWGCVSLCVCACHVHRGHVTVLGKRRTVGRCIPFLLAKPPSHLLMHPFRTCLLNCVPFISMHTQLTGRQHTAVPGVDTQHVVNKRWIRQESPHKSFPFSWNSQQTPTSFLLLPPAGDFMAPSYTESASAALLRDPETGGGQIRSEATGAGEENQPGGGT